MKITEISIQNYRSLKDITITDIKPFNVFIGKNGAGKSHILEALDLFFRDLNLLQETNEDFEENLWFDRDKNHPIKFSIRFELPENVFNKIFNEDILNQLPLLKSDIRNDFKIERQIIGNKWNNIKTSVGDIDDILPSQLIEFYNLKNKEISDFVLTELTKFIKTSFKLCHTTRESGNQSSARIRPFLMDDKTIDYLTLIGKSQERDHSKLWAKHQYSFNDFSSYQMEMRGDAVHYKQGDLYLPLNLLGGGDQRILDLEWLLFSNFYSIYGIEEPETCLHAGYQRKLLNKFKETSKNNQLFITTHSPVFVDKIDFNNSSIWSVTKEGKTTNVEHIDIEDSNNLKEILMNLDIRMSDIFFAEKILFVEGATEREIIPMIAEKLNINLIKEGAEIIAMRGKNNGKYHIEMWHHISKNTHLPIFYVFDGDAEKEVNASKEKGYLTNDNHHMLKENDIEDLYPEKLTKDVIKDLIPSIDIDDLDISVPRKNKLVNIFKKNDINHWKLELGRNVISKMSKEQVRDEMRDFKQIFDKFLK